MVRIARGIDDATLDREPSIFTVINSNSPLRLDTPMLHGIIEMASRNQPVVMTPFTLAGAMAPVTLAGALAQQNAENWPDRPCQIVAPALRCTGFTSNVDMQSGAPAFGTGYVARQWSAASWPGGTTCLPQQQRRGQRHDARRVREVSRQGCVMGGVNMMMHGAGWMEGGLRQPGKMVLDADLLHMVSSMMDPVVVDDTLATDATQRPARWSLLRCAAHAGSLPHRLLQADGQRLKHETGTRRAAGGWQGSRSGGSIPRRIPEMDTHA
jgi:trimethylamine--corrinoid protein Co-methyltransferase